MRYSFHRTELGYSGLTLHTASSGPVVGLDTLYFVLDDGETRAVGETRLNCAYLNGYAADTLLDAARAHAARTDWSRPPSDLRSELANLDLPAPVRMLFDCTLWDLSARRAGVPLAHLLAGQAVAIDHATNQTLFLSSNAAFDARADAYVARGFRDLKIRVGQYFEADCARLARLRRRFGKDLKLSVDANGLWSVAETPAFLNRLVEYDVAYVEQPIAPGNWDALSRLAEGSPMPLMLDESMVGPRDVAEIIARTGAAQGRLWAHLKLIKTGGITPALAAVRALRRAGVPFMIGQMNEGSLATAAALHLACATQPEHAELYGADGLADDPAGGLTYADGRVSAPLTSGLGISFTAPRANDL
ncbi:hypothetical protein P775_12955 [Puniceibacterium antarcticum]|uniref:Mandelate racemase/muconate lactonizing enzyme C-terminal domain-containing protein n=1 Tax=Puniceibacterium antarcticum TaxID=1206336 RepID=A0A2G8RDV4_9RHOB|nr:enolase C-terminal domain-like protein [Puniceibacterium antarcticum]PIL19754.1 hypothetical protein P775_12955 [Puniceibacterium antarcticum]